MEDMDQSPLVSSSSDSPPRPQPPFKYQFVREPEDEEEDEEEEDEEEEDEDLEELEVLERKPATGLSAAPVPTAPVAGAPLLDFGSDFVPPAPRGPLPAAPPAAPERPPSWDSSPVSPAVPAPSLPSAAAALPSKLPEDDEPPARPPPPPPASVSPQAEPAWTPPAPAPAAPPSTPAAPKRRGSSGSVDETLFALPAAYEPVIHSSAVVDLLYWRDIKKTGVVFGASLFLLLSLTVFSIVSVTAYIVLALLSVTISFRIYKGVIQAIQKSDEGHPFRAYLESEVAISEELVQKYSNSALGHVNCTIKELRRLFLVDDLVDSLKFAALMWVFTYVGALFNGLTLLILALISLFSVPVIYERHQAQIDHYLGLANKSVKDAMAKIQAKIPGLKRKAE
ncbi:reticulon-4 isoform X2 [Mustela nigripes]|uniref:Reticulon n=1 Tax=Mustela putorius furo TaxID=9669 RepID=A0A8U0NCL4_MUSPF|nr:reticulon-4 isoform X2 [Mustela putorius furo]XP_032208028.1 reticulon-4 isoform X2 [Mustela erminea]XP_044119899.1 reticulon-4 isoform X2 [Neogale vison]XP_047599655.1 reticulon-4 isoform X2 [Lutra lutra]XP_059262052.1 reticulon-4 isoform X2 [Mustela nigripes]